MNEKEQINTPPELGNAAQEINDELFPKKSKQRYERLYTEFQNWRKTNNANSFSERTILAYFAFLSKRNKPTTL